VSFEPLAGIRVVDVTTSLAGPYCTEVLAALGADVVKVEPPDGDHAREWGPPFAAGGQGVLFLAANAGKRSLALSLADGRGQEALLRVAAEAHVFVQSLRPGLAERKGFGPEALRAENPALVYCTIGAFGRHGPLADEPGYDPLMQAAAGIVSLTGEPGRPGVRVGTSIVDLGTGVWAALAIVAALLGGGGQTIDLSLYETAVALVGYQLTGYLASGTVPGREGTAFPLIAPYQVFPTAEGELMIAAGNDGLWRRLREALDLPDDARFRTNPDRVRNRDELVAAISERLRALPSAAWLERLRAAGVPVAPVQDVGQVAEAEQTAALGLLQDVGTHAVPALPLSFDGERPRHRSPAPAVGAHTAAVLAEAGYSAEEVAELAAAGVVRLG
jgi:crotonobetainyl-CoA:carnitine CoA-transferase CaiB-like acyl-CoA transferase